jgi:hypothetical protein
MGLLFWRKPKPSKREIEAKLDSDRPIEAAEVTGAIDCALERLEAVMDSSTEQIQLAARRLSEQSRAAHAPSVFPVKK